MNSIRKLKATAHSAIIWTSVVIPFKIISVSYLTVVEEFKVGSLYTHSYCFIFILSRAESLCNDLRKNKKKGDPVPFLSFHDCFYKNKKIQHLDSFEKGRDIKVSLGSSNDLRKE